MQEGQWQTYMTSNVMQCIVQAASADGRMLCRMRATCKSWWMAIKRLPDALLQPFRSHEVRIDCLCDLDEAILAGFPGHAHGFVRLQAQTGWRLLEDAFYVRRNVNVHRVWSNQSSFTKWLQHMKVIGSHNAVANQVLCLGEIKTNDLFVFVKRGGAPVYAEQVPNLTFLSGDMIKWRFVSIARPLKKPLEKWDPEYVEEMHCRFSTLDFDKWFYGVQWLLVLHVPMYKNEHFPHAMFNDPNQHLPGEYALWDAAKSPNWTHDEIALSKACKEASVAVKQQHNKKKKRKTNEDSE